jgi:hypothetical protein
MGAPLPRHYCVGYLTILSRPAGGSLGVIEEVEAVERPVMMIDEWVGLVMWRWEGSVKLNVRRVFSPLYHFVPRPPKLYPCKNLILPLFVLKLSELNLSLH